MGDCKVTVKNRRGKETTVASLVKGQHFGEVGMIYDCERSATVYSMNYNIYAVLTPQKY